MDFPKSGFFARDDWLQPVLLLSKGKSCRYSSNVRPIGLLTWSRASMACYVIVDKEDKGTTGFTGVQCNVSNTISMNIRLTRARTDSKAPPSSVSASGTLPRLGFRSYTTTVAIEPSGLLQAPASARSAVTVLPGSGGEKPDSQPTYHQLETTQKARAIWQKLAFSVEIDITLMIVPIPVAQKNFAMSHNILLVRLPLNLRNTTWGLHYRRVLRFLFELEKP